MIAIALHKTTATITPLASTAPSYLRRHRREHPEHLVLLIHPNTDLSRVLALYRP